MELFPCTVLDESLDISDEYNAKLHKHILEITPKSPRAFACDTTFWTTNLVDDPLFDELKAKIVKTSEKYGVNKRFVVDQMWASVTRYGCYHGVHSHGSHPLCGVYYVRVPEHPDGYHLRFLNDKWTLRANEVDVPIRTKQMLMFEGWVLHGYAPNQSYDPKVSVAFNLRIVSDNSFDAAADNGSVTPESTVPLKSL